MDPADAAVNIESLIDPLLRTHSPVPIPDAPDAQQADTSDLDPAAGTQADANADDASRSRKRKSRIVPGSTADFRRKEANRLAAERSRLRAAEGLAALVNSVNAAKKENDRLKVEVAQLEEEVGQPERLGGGVGIGSGNGGSTSGTGVGAGSGSGLKHDAETEGQGDTTGGILEALMADGEWMKGVESFIKEAESGGRLDELASIAAGQEGKGRGISEAEIDSAQERDHSSADAAPALEQGEETNASRAGLAFTIAGANNATAAAMAVALNTEMERILRNNLALTRAALAHVERQIASLQTADLPDATPMLADPSAPISTLPDNILYADQESLLALPDEAHAEADKLQAEFPGISEEANRMKDAKVAEEAKLAELVERLQAAEGELDGGPRERIRSALSGITGFVGTLLSAANEEKLDPLVNFNSPATARRRRGRPPKGQQSLIYSSSVGIGSPSPVAPLAKDKKKSKPGSRLRKSSVPAPEQAVQPGEVPLPGSEAEEHQRTAEEYILSHLQHHATAEDGTEEGVPMEGTTFADLLPAQAMQADAAEIAGTARGDAPMFSPHEEGGLAAPLSTPARTLAALEKKRPGPGCDICGRTETSAWRKLSWNGDDLKVCNACGLYYHKFKMLRPAELWGDGKSVRKRRTGARASASAAGEEAAKRQKVDGGGSMVETLTDHAVLGSLGEAMAGGVAMPGLTEPPQESASVAEQRQPSEDVELGQLNVEMPAEMVGHFGGDDVALLHGDMSVFGM